jgi:hypothetical protein
MMISKIELKFFQVDLMLDFFMRFRLELLEVSFKNYSLGIKFHFSNF